MKTAVGRSRIYNRGRTRSQVEERESECEQSERKGKDTKKGLPKCVNGRKLELVGGGE